MKTYHYKNDPGTTFYPCHKKDSKDINIHVDCGGVNRNRRNPAFRAVKSLTQPLAADEVAKITFEQEEFDIGNIYNAGSSTFVPRESGVYYVAASFTFGPDENVPYRTRADIVVNGVTVQVDNDYWNELGNLNVINVSAVLQLQAGDLVEIFGTSSTAGLIFNNLEDSSLGYSTNFEAFKVS